MAGLHDTTSRGFASDNYSGVHPEVLQAIADANDGHQSAYGNDVYTARFQEVVQARFGSAAVGFPVFNGTGANVTALLSILPRWGAVVCAKTAHINVDEGGAPEKVGGIKLYPVVTKDGKLTPELLDSEAWGYGDEHRAQPVVVSITQPTELGTLYTPEEIKAVAARAHERGMLVHLDGARLPNAAAALDVDLAAITSEVGVDIVSLGGTKNGALGAEAVVVVDGEKHADVVEAIRYNRKSVMQLASKMRFISAQLVALYEDDLWLRGAQHANAMARRLRDALADVPGVQFTQETRANGVFAILPAGVADVVRERFAFYDWDEARLEVRWMCSFDTTEEDIDSFAAAIREACANARA